MTDLRLMRIEVAFARPDEQRILELQLAEGSTAREAVRASGLAELCPEIDAERCPVGVFGEKVAGDRILKPGDRVEIYRPLTVDPRERRRLLAAKGETMAGTRVGDK